MNGLTSRIFEEINRCLKPGGKYSIGDVPRHESVCEVVPKVMIKPKEIKPGLVSSINAFYIVQEITSISSKTNLELATIRKQLGYNWRETL
jgi:hypothetical protein